MNRLYVISLLSCLLWWGLSACGELTQPQGERVTQSPLASPTAEQLVHSSVATPTPPLATATSTAIVTPSPTLYLPTLTPTSSQPTATQTPNFQITLDQSKLGPPVTELVYMTMNRVNPSSPNYLSTIWRTNLDDIIHPQVVITMTHWQQSRPNDLTISPNTQYLVFGQAYDELRMQAQLLNMEEGEVQTIANDVFLHINAHSFFWSADSTAIIYTKIPDNWSETSVYHYSLLTGETQVLFQADGFIVPLNWQDATIYYILENRSDTPYTVWKYDMQTGQVKMLFSLANRSSYIKPSPDGNLALFGEQVWDLEATSQITQTNFYHPLWLPDSQGFIAADETDFRTRDMTISLQQLTETYVTPLTVSFDAPLPLGELLAWSPDGHYLIYQPPQTTSYYLLNTLTGQVQEFAPTTVLTVGGWISE